MTQSQMLSGVSGSASWVFSHMVICQTGTWGFLFVSSVFGRCARFWESISLDGHRTARSFICVISTGFFCPFKGQWQIYLILCCSLMLLLSGDTYTVCVCAGRQEKKTFDGSLKLSIFTRKSHCANTSRFKLSSVAVFHLHLQIFCRDFSSAY